jgi:hypothetical protein
VPKYCFEQTSIYFLDKKSKFNFLELFWQGFFTKPVWSQCFEQATRSLMRFNFMSLIKDDDFLLVSCIVHLGVQLFLPLHLSNHGQ